MQSLVSLPLLAGVVVIVRVGVLLRVVYSRTRSVQSLVYANFSLILIFYTKNNNFNTLNYFMKYKKLEVKGGILFICKLKVI